MPQTVNVNLGEIVGKGYGAFWNCTKRYRVVKGGKASKKSTTASLWYIVNLMNPAYSKANLLVIRSVFNTHAKSTFSQLKWAIDRLGVNAYWKATTSPLELTYRPTGQKIIFAGFDDWQKLASTTVEKGYLCWVWIEEAFELTSEEDFEKLDMSVPRGEVPAPLFKQTTLTLNPWSEKHWIKRRFFDNQGKDVFTLTTNYMCNEHLDEVDRALYEKMKEENPRRYAVAGLGEWGISEGLIYDRWEEKAFDIQSILNGENGWKFKCVFGLDYGYTNDPSAFIAMAVNPIDKIIYIYDEFYQTRMQNTDIATEITRRNFQKERIRADSADPKSNDNLRQLGISRLQKCNKKGKNYIIGGIQILQDYRMIVHPICVNTVAELSSYIWSKNASTDEAQNRPEDKNNHLMDAMRYAMEDIAYFKPEAVRQLRSTYKDRMRTVKHMGGGGVRPSDFKGGWG